MSKILFFSAPWCGPCSQMKKIITEDLMKELNIEIIDISKDISMSTKYEIMNVPTFIKLEDEIIKSKTSGTVTIDMLRSL